MSRGASEEPRSLRETARKSRQRRKWPRSRTGFLAVAAVAVVIIVTAVLVALLVDQNRDSARRAALASETSTTGLNSPYDLTEMPPETDLDVVEEAAFVSISLVSDEGRLTSYGIDADEPAVRALIRAISEAHEADAGTALALDSHGIGSPGGTGTSSTITFALPTRETLTFALDLQHGLVARGDRAWRPEADLADLIEAATTRP